jgi:DNA segregation ATPase FtsK/SpoIIIE, S-DNA-T family
VSKAKGRSKPRRKAAERQPARQGFLGIITSPVVRRLLLIIVVVVLLYVVWAGMLRLFGYGLVIVAVALGWLIWLTWQRQFSVVKHRWNWVLGGAFLALALWGILSFFPGEGVLGNATLGGRVGLSIIRAPDALGGLRVAGLVLLGIVLIMPRRAWSGVRKLRGAARTGRELLARGFSRRPAVSVPLLAPAEEASADTTAPDAAAGAELDAKPAGVASPPVWQSQHEPILTPGGWQLPPIDILEKPTEVKLDKDDIDQRARLIEEALASYGVEAKVVQANIGPTVTQFGVEPGWDKKYKEVREKGRDGIYETRLEEVSRTRVRVERITSLSNDLSLALAAPSIRIEAPVPGASVIGIEVPNSVFGSVALRGVIETAAFQKIKGRSKLAIAMGKGAGGEAAAADLTRMPHLLIAGSTGSGKTVCLNSIICCLLLHNSPDDVQFIMIDPKRVELVTFNGLPHLLAPVIVDSGRAVKALKWLTYEMDNRYREFAQVGARNIEGYNRDRSPSEQMPYLVLIIDELADLMLVAADEVEHTLCRLAQLARATGIHLVVATQRPSVDVVTGLIKANFPTRVSFAVTSQVDSRTILDMVGAEKLLGRGDMLYMPTEASKPKRLQGTMVLDAEIDRLVYFWGTQRQIEVRTVDFDEAGEHGSGVHIASAPDPLLGDAMRLAQEHKHVSASFLQRRLHIGYPRAARLMEELEQAGLIETAQPGRQG